MGWEENIKKLDKLNVYNYENDIAAENDDQRSKRIVKKLLRSSRYTPVFKLHEVFQDKHDPKKLSIMHINIRSMKENFDTLVHHLNKFERLPDIICITETHFTDDQDLHKFELLNYSLYAKSRSIMKQGGVAVYVNNNFQVLARDDLDHFEEQVFESLFLEIRTRASNFRLLCGVIYRTDTKEKVADARKRFCTLMSNTLDKIMDDNTLTVCLCGDFNLDLQNDEFHTREYKKNMYEKNFFSCINRPTKSKKKGCSLIDHMWCNKVEHFSNSAILVDKFADHLAICCFLRTDQPHFAKTNEFDATESNLQKFSEAVEKCQAWKEVDENSLEKQAQMIIERNFSRLKTLANVDKNSVNAAINSIETEICKNLEMLFKNSKKQSARKPFNSFVKILKNASDHVQQLHSSWIPIEKEWLLTESEIQALNEATNEFVRCSESLTSCFCVSDNDLNDVEDFDELVSTEEASAPLTRKKFIAVPDNIGVSLDPIRVAKSRAFFLNQTTYDDFLRLFEHFGKCCSENACLLAQNLIPVEMVVRFPIEVREKLLSLLREIYLCTFESVEMFYDNEKHEIIHRTQEQDLQRGIEQLAITSV